MSSRDLPRRRLIQGGLGLGGLALLAGRGITPPWTRAPQMPRVGYLGTASSSAPGYVEDFRAGLRDLGYGEGRDIAIEYRFAEGDNDRLPGLAAELVERRVDVIVTHARGVAAAHRATASIPIVMLVFADAVAAGLVDSLAHPGGNITGSTAFTAELVAKRMELLKVALPSLSSAAFLLNPDYPVNGPIVEAIERTGNALGVAVQHVEARASPELEPAIVAMAGRGQRALVLHDDPLFVGSSSLIASLAEQHGLMAIGALEFARAGGPLAYGVEFRDLHRRAASFVDRILKGAKPGDLPVERATNFQLLVNPKAAQAVGLTIPPSLLAQATELIQ